MSKKIPQSAAMELKLIIHYDFHERLSSRLSPA